MLTITGVTGIKKLEWSILHMKECYKDIEKFEHDYGYRLTDQQFRKLSTAIIRARNTIHGVMMEGYRQVAAGEIGNEKKDIIMDQAETLQASV